MTAILGITDGDDAGAVLLVRGRIAAAVNEERLNRMKMSRGFPTLAIQEVLRIGGLLPRDITHVAMAAHTETFMDPAVPNRGWFQEPSTTARIRNEVSSALAGPLGGSKLARRAHYQVKRALTMSRRHRVQGKLHDLGIDAPISYHEHHRCHAIAAFDTSGFERALSLTLDGGGDGCSSHVYLMDQRRVRSINQLDSFDSIGNYYAYVTHLCGFRASIHEGKITGLAARGAPVYKRQFEELIDYEKGQIRNIGRLFFSGAINHLRHTLPQDWEHKDLAASIQQHLEDVALHYVQFWLRRSGMRRICLSGGVFANVVLNQRIAELPECDEVFVFPAMGDGGLAAGSAFSAYRELPAPLTPLEADAAFRHVYLGPEYTPKEIESALLDHEVPFEEPADIEDTVARLVQSGKVVARFDGRMEYGPRALGNRTILYKTDDPAVNTWLNERLNRSEFMPFAPICLPEEKHRLFDWNPAVRSCMPYMTITQDCSDWMKTRCPAVVHVDGTARPQFVSDTANPGMHRILQRYHELTGVPLLVNTSFNMHEEPIVCTPGDAIRAYQRGRLDYLAIGPFLLGYATGRGVPGGNGGAA